MPGYDLGGRIKERLTALEVVEFYGFHPDRGGFIQCPFHQGDKHGSLKIYEGDRTGWHCFGCGAGGSVIDFVMRLFDIDFRQACVRLNVDFGLGLTDEKPSREERSALLEARRMAAVKKAEHEAEYCRKAAEFRYCNDIITHFEPVRTQDGEVFIHPLYAEAVKCLPVLEYWLDEHLGG